MLTPEGCTFCAAALSSKSLLAISQGIGLERNRDEWMLRMRRMGSCPCKQLGRPITRFRSNAIPCEIANRLLELNAAAQNVQHTGVNKGSGFVLTPCCPGGASGAGAVA